jgi:arabinofuranosyltransferase
MLLLAAGLAIACAVSWHLRLDLVIDDAFISFRYLDNWLAGHGLVFNSGERVEGYTNLLWIVLLAPLRMAGMAPEMASRTLSLLFFGLLVWAVRDIGSGLGGRASGWAAAALTLSSPMLVRWTTSGMETIAYIALLVIGTRRVVRRSGFDPAAGLFFGLAFMARPPGLLHAVLACLVFLPFRRQDSGATRKIWLLGVLSMAGIVSALTLFRLAYYGDPVPNTFYAKLTGELPSLLPAGLAYAKGFFLAGGGLLALMALPVVLSPRIRDRGVALLVGQVVVQLIYSIRVGGDPFPHHRFLVVAIPALAILASLGIDRLAERLGRTVRERLSWAAVITLIVLQSLLSNVDGSNSRLAAMVVTNEEREQLAGWIAGHFDESSLLAINAAGRVPYRTKLTTIDMLGLNDRHIARVRSSDVHDGAAFVGHFKHDGDYVCSRRPDVVVTSGARLFSGRNPAEAAANAATNTFASDRSFLRSPDCRDLYRPLAAEIFSPGKYAVVFVPREPGSEPSPETSPGDSAKDWFEKGLRHLQRSELEEAVAAFEETVRLDPTSTTAWVNLGYSHFDQRAYGQAEAAFLTALRLNPETWDALFGLALTSQRIGRKEEAVILWRRYISEAPESTWTERAQKNLDLLLGTSP